MLRSISIIRRAAAMAALAAVGTSGAHAQQGGFTSLYPGQPRVSVGARAGVTFATISGDAVEEAGYRPGFAGGLVGTINVNPLLAIQPEVLYVQGGANIDEDGGVTPFGLGEQTLRISTVEVPVLLRVNVPTRSAAVPYLYAGPSFGFVVSASREYDEVAGGTDDDLIEDEDFEDAVKSTQIGMAVGAGFDLRLPVTGRVTLDGRYTFGLTDVFDEDELGLADAPDAKSGAFQLTLGFGL